VPGLRVQAASRRSSHHCIHITTLASTVPANGDVNPYGVAVIPHGTGHLGRGNILVSNFNNKANVQGTGTTIVQITPHGHVSLFAKVSRHLRGCPGGVGLTTALTVLRSGWVIVGSLPTKGGSVSGSGCLIVLDRWGPRPGDVRRPPHQRPVGHDLGRLRAGGRPVRNQRAERHRRGQGRDRAPRHGGADLLVIPPGRMPFIVRSDIIGSGFGEHLDPAALVIGPTGVGLGRNGTLYVADTVANRIAAIPGAVFRVTDAGPGFTVSQGHALWASSGWWWRRAVTSSP
jgi:hypothetical protein